MRTALLKLENDHINEESISKAIDEQYLISCSHDLVCDASSACGCYKDIKTYVWRKISQILGYTKLPLKRFLDVGVGKFSEICSVCKPAGPAPRQGKMESCLSLYAHALGSHEEPVKGLSFTLDCVLTSAPNLVSFYKMTPHPTYPLSSCCARPERVSIYEYITGELGESLNIQGVGNYKPKRISRFLGNLSEERLKMLGRITWFYLWQDYIEMKCIHSNSLAQCMNPTWLGNQEPIQCRAKTMQEVTNKLKTMLGSLALLEESQDPKTGFKKIFCIRCNAGNYPSVPQPIQCQKSLITHSYSLPSLIRWLLEYIMRYSLIGTMATPELRNVKKAYESTLECMKTSTKIHRATGTTGFAHNNKTNYIYKAPDKSAVMLYGKTRTCTQYLDG